MQICNSGLILHIFTAYFVFVTIHVVFKKLPHNMDEQASLCYLHAFDKCLYVWPTLYVSNCCIVCFSIHLCVTLVHTRPGVADRFIHDFVKCIEEIMQTPNAKCGGQVCASCEIIIIIIIINKVLIKVMLNKVIAGALSRLRFVLTKSLVQTNARNGWRTEYCQCL